MTSEPGRDSLRTPPVNQPSPIARSRPHVTVVLIGAGLAVCCTVTLGQQRVADTVHNLSVAGPGSVRAQSEQEICVFCHAPHNTGPMRPLWNRDVSPASYQIYQSSTLDASPGQPTGSSKLCLSCHDGTIAL
ncbi:MAG: hypothetical protein ACE5EX_04940, partial [Phycisphaerae bacterium]